MVESEVLVLGWYSSSVCVSSVLLMVSTCSFLESNSGEAAATAETSFGEIVLEVVWLLVSPFLDEWECDRLLDLTDFFDLINQSISKDGIVLSGSGFVVFCDSIEDAEVSVSKDGSPYVFSDL